MLSNSSAPEIERLYSTPEARLARLRIERVAARRAINSRAEARGPVTEFVITNVTGPRSVGINALCGTRPTPQLRMAKATMSVGRVRASDARVAIGTRR